MNTSQFDWYSQNDTSGYSIAEELHLTMMWQSTVRG